MISNVEITLYDKLSDEIKFSAKYETKDEHHSKYFWDECAESWHNRSIHKVYACKTNDTNQLLGFFSVLANQITIYNEGEKQYIPIIDVAFIDVNTRLDGSSSKAVLQSLLEFIEFEIAKSITSKLGCRFIRCYIPTEPVKNEHGAYVDGIHLYDYYQEILEKMKYIEPPVKDSDKIRRVKRKYNGKGTVTVLKYYIRDLLIKEN